MSLNVLRRKLGELVGGSGVCGSVSAHSIELAQGRLFSSSARVLSNYKVRGLLFVEPMRYTVSFIGILASEARSVGRISHVSQLTVIIVSRQPFRSLITSMMLSLSGLGVLGCALRWGCRKPA